MSEPVHRFTQDARHVLGLAQEEADRQGVAIDTKLLLLALLRDEQGVAGQILRVLGLDASQVEALTRRTGRSFRAPQPTVNEQPQPLLILDENGGMLVSNEAAQDLIDHHMDELVNALRGMQGTSEVAVGDRTYLTLSGHLSEGRIVVMMHDITHVKDLERENKAFTAAVSNQLMMPLSALKGWAELLRHHTQQDQTAQRFVDRISGSADAMAKMLSQLSDFSAH